MKFSNTKALITRVLAALALAAASVGGLSGIAEAATCLTCHAPVGSTTDIRPVESTYRNITTGSIKGSHAIHMPSATLLASACSSCHGAEVTSTKHRNGLIEVPGVGYLKGASFPQSGNPALSTCSAASCHASPIAVGVTVTTPVWGTAGNGCASCHMGANAITASGPATGSHTNTPAHAVACTSCHAVGTTATTAPTLANGHNDGNIDTANVGYATLNKTKGTAGVTCSTATCHANVYGAGFATTPVWGATAGCEACHSTPIAATGPATGSHAIHNTTTCVSCHTGSTTNLVNPTVAHADGKIDVNSGYPANVAKHTTASGFGGRTCSTASCHGSSSPVWGNNTANNACTKCHGTPSVTVTAATSHLLAPIDAAGVGTGKVSTDLQIGAHQTHLQFFNGLSGQRADAEALCIECHGALPISNSHAITTSSIPAFQGLATKGGTYSTSFNAGSCSVYCHNPAAATGGTLAAGNSGTGTTPLWTNAAYVADGTLKTDANCNTCHKSPGNGSFTSTTNHDAVAMPLGINTDCTGCHGHNGASGGIAGQQHMDGIKYGGGNCDSCHDYDTTGAAYTAGKWSVGSWGKAGTNYGGYTNVAEGWGAHAKHITFIKTRIGNTTGLTASGQTFGAGEPANVCGTCHTNVAGNHKMSGATGDTAGRFINFGDSTFKMNGATGISLLFGAANPSYSPTTLGVSGSSSSTNPKTCSNISCHYFTTPIWSAP